MQNNQLYLIEHNLKALRAVSPTLLSIEDRIEYYQALIEVIKEKMYFYIKQGSYRTSIEMECEVVQHEKHVDWLLTLVQNYTPVLEADNKYLKFSRGEFDLALHTDAKAMLNTIFFGTGVKIESVGENYLVITSTLPSIDIANCTKAMERYCKDQGFEVVKDKKLRKQYSLTDNQFLVNLAALGVDIK